jgi:hypothetical protein
MNTNNNNNFTYLALPSIVVSGICGVFSHTGCDSYLYAYALFGLFPRTFAIKSFGFILTYSDANRLVYYREVGQEVHYSSISSSKLHPM